MTGVIVHAGSFDSKRAAGSTVSKCSRGAGSVERTGASKLFTFQSEPGSHHEMGSFLHTDYDVKRATY